MLQERWFQFAFLSALAASIIPILSRVGLKTVDSNLAAVIRGVFMAAALLIIGSLLGVWSKTSTLRLPAASGEKGPYSLRALALIALTGIAGATSWLFYFKALKLAEASKVAAVDKLSVPLAVLLAVIVLGERPLLINWLGVALVVAGAYLVAIPPPPQTP